ncbi:MAG: class I SAM-dependent methyltransferase, partial [Rhizobiales bacterium]|nr:class I SAM-dependent methyltransferase [Hyphomicrobiales bacterium]
VATHANSQIRDEITARALAPLSKLFGLALPFFSPRSVTLFPKGREAEVEIEEAKKRFDFDCALAPSLTDAQARIVIVRNLAARTEG